MYQSSDLSLESNVIREIKPKIPDHEKDFTQAKMILKQISVESGESLYDHLAEIIQRALCDRPRNVMDNFEDFSRKIRQNRYHHVPEGEEIHEKEKNEEDFEGKLTKSRQFIEDFQKLQELRANHDTEDDDKILAEKVIHPNLMSLKSIYDLIGIGMPSRDIYLLTLSQEKFLRDKNIKSCRFWGKIYGLERNYWIFEVQLTEEAIAERLQKTSKEQISEENVESPLPASTTTLKDETSKSKNAIPPLPQSKFVPNPDTPAESLGEGVNRYLYYASNNAFGDKWHELPLATPKQILVSKQIKKALTGNLSAKVISYPKMQHDETEAHLLRALIARITASTFVAPLNYWVARKPTDISGEEAEETEEEEEEEEEEDEIENDTELFRNPKFEPPSYKDLKYLSFWVHVRPFIQKHGRIQTYKEQKIKDGEEQLEEEEELEEEIEEEEEEQNDIENVPPLLNPCTEDVISCDTTPAWTVKTIHNPNPVDAVTLMRSNLWPGAVAFARDKIADMIYVGWAQKYCARNYEPPNVPQMHDEYPLGPDILEINDPTAAEENEHRQKMAQNEKLEATSDEDDGEGEETLEETEDDEE
ncbi:radial spoke head protein 6 homolog A [Culicoides brevitarsis]|uniref:radial spoke head protein 6 homolog A n=1 Tax=Culicoides brevitarsis TaxID=469753 RepID=UPI00307B40E4